jgi:acetyl-CoA carboxylase biotin carboxyl carrier protein
LVWPRPSERRCPAPSTAAPDPESDVYVNEGDEVSAGDTVGLIEVMKSFHEVKAEEDGTVSKFLVENEDAVDAGQDLVELE